MWMKGHSEREPWFEREQRSRFSDPALCIVSEDVDNSALGRAAPCYLKPGSIDALGAGCCARCVGATGLSAGCMHAWTLFK